MGGKAGPKRDDPTFVDEWSNHHNFGSDSNNFERAGGDQSTYEAMTPEERAEWRKLTAPGSKTTKDEQTAWVERTKSSPHTRPTGGGGQAITPGMEPFLGMTPNLPVRGGPGGRGGAGAGGARGNGVTDPYLQAATPNVNSAWGGTQTTQNPDGTFTVNNTLSPGMQQGQDSLQAQWAQALQNPLDGNSARDQAIDSAYKQATSRLDPQWDKRSEAMRTQLLNQGLDPTSQAGRNAMQEMGMQRNDAYTSALASAIAQGTSAGDSVFRNNLAAQNNPLQQMQVIRGLSQTAPPTNLLNAAIAKGNTDLGRDTATLAANTDLATGGMQLTGAALNSLSNLGK